MCDNGVCDASTLIADMAAGVASVELLREGDAWKPVVTRVAKGEHAVTYSRHPSGS